MGGVGLDFFQARAVVGRQRVARARAGSREQDARGFGGFLAGLQRLDVGVLRGVGVAGSFLGGGRVRAPSSLRPLTWAASRSRSRATRSPSYGSTSGARRSLAKAWGGRTQGARIGHRAVLPRAAARAAAATPPPRHLLSPYLLQAGDVRD